MQIIGELGKDIMVKCDCGNIFWLPRLKAQTARCRRCTRVVGLGLDDDLLKGRDETMLPKLVRYLPEDLARPLAVLPIMTYELGALAREVVYANHRLGHSVSVEARIALADLVTQCAIIAELCGWDWDELRHDGRERFVERMKEVKSWREAQPKEGVK